MLNLGLKTIAKYLSVEQETPEQETMAYVFSLSPSKSRGRFHDLIAPSPSIPLGTIRWFFSVDHSLAGARVVALAQARVSPRLGEFPPIIASRSNGSTQNHVAGGNPFLHDNYGVTGTWHVSNVTDWRSKCFHFASSNDSICSDRAGSLTWHKYFTEECKGTNYSYYERTIVMRYLLESLFTTNRR